MSLLLEALKKAEKEKEEAQRQARLAEIGERQAADPKSTQGSGRRVVTRAELPDISQPLEIFSEDLSSGGPARSAGLALEPETPPSAGSPGGPAPRGDASRAGTDELRPHERASSRAYVEDAFREPNPRLPFYASLGVLGAIALCGIAYFWVQLRPAASFVNASPPRPAAEKPVDLAQLKPSAASGAHEPQGTRSQPAIPGLPAVSPTAAAVPPGEPNRAAGASSAPASSAFERAAPPAGKGLAKGATPAAAVSAKSPTAPESSARTGETSRAVSVNRVTAEIHPQVLAGYRSYQAGDLSTARAEYHQALREDPRSRDALLGLAAIEMRAQRYEQSEAYYERLLQFDPRDPNALAGLLALRNQLIDPVQAESRVKSTLASDPGATVLYFTLGNQYAQQGRWAEAQQAYFKAYAADSENPDFAFNLAVSLDQLRHSGLALEYYRRALALTEKRAASFAPEIARQRELQLSR